MPQIFFVFSIFAVLLCSCSSFSPRKPAAQSAADAITLYHQHYDPICKKGFSDQVSPQQIKVITDSMGMRDHRIWHYFWHATRNSWHQLTEEQRQFFLSFDARWKPERLLGAPQNSIKVLGNSDQYDPEKNDAGEDFLYMHHTMMTELFQALADKNLPCIAPWTQLPPKNDVTWAIPKDSKESPKDDTSYQKMEAWRKNFQDSRYNSQKTLGDVGYLLEVSLHNNMHMRWSTNAPPKGFGERPDITPESLKSGLAPYDSPKYNWLADPYSAHTNKVFWKLHGLVELTLFSWLSANGYASAEKICGGAKGCYQWKGTWVGAAPHADPPKGMGSGSGHHDHVMMGPSFEESFLSAVDNFVNGGDPKAPPQMGSGNPRDVMLERDRKKQLVRSALRILNKNSPMNRGALNKDILQKTDNPAYDDPAEYVRFIDQQK